MDSGSSVTVHNIYNIEVSLLKGVCISEEEMK